MHHLLDSLPLAIFAVSILSTKAVHLYIHCDTVSGALLLLYLPSLLLQDACLILLLRSLLRRGKTWVSSFGALITWPICFVTLFAASSQIGFFYETGGEMEWEDAGTFATDAEGIKVLLGGGQSVAMAAIALLGLSWATRSSIFRLSGDTLTQIRTFLAYVASGIAAFCRRRAFAYETIRLHDRGYDSEQGHANGGHGSPEPVTNTRTSNSSMSTEACDGFARSSSRHRRSGIIFVIAVFLVLTSAFRPRKPYNHMSVSLPVLMLEVFKLGPDFCDEQEHINGNHWPFPDQIEKSRWLAPTGVFKGWAPGPDNSFARLYRKRIPEWLPEPAPQGFQRWDPWRFEYDRAEEDLLLETPSPLMEHPKIDTQLRCGENGTKDEYYNPVSDPMRIYNLDQDILSSLRPSVGDGSVHIRHVVLVLMESLRSELFPLQQGSDMHRFILESQDFQDREATNALLSRLTPNTEIITGVPGNFRSDTGVPFERVATSWESPMGTDFGGINVVGALSPSSSSTKSLAVANCGVWPMAVDDFEEAMTRSYQPCLPQIFDLFNTLKGEASDSDADPNWREHEWMSGFFQATTDDYDRQDIFDDKIGFKHTVNKQRLLEDIEQYPNLEEVNYFGYPETALRPYIKDFIRDVQLKDQRMFLSHFTSTTHHPWGTPDWFNNTQYMRTDGMRRWHKEFDEYLNAIRFHDAWLGELMQTFEDEGILNETLVVFASDHGQAFREDTTKTGTYENGHISNFRVGLTFWHSHLSRHQYAASTTSLSVLPTILDLLISTGSLNNKDESAALDLLHDYEGQSLIRPYVTNDGDRRAWNFGIVNSGGGLLTVTSADTTFRLVMPLGQEVAYTFTDLDRDPHELHPTSKWSIEDLNITVGVQHGPEAASWVVEAKIVADWWWWERKRLWAYNRGD